MSGGETVRHVEGGRFVQRLPGLLNPYRGFFAVSSPAVMAVSKTVSKMVSGIFERKQTQSLTCEPKECRDKLS